MADPTGCDCGNCDQPLTREQTDLRNIIRQTDEYARMFASVTQPPPWLSEPAQPEESTVPDNQPVTEVLEGEFWPAIKPLLDLLGVTPFHVIGRITVEAHSYEDPTLCVRFQRVVEPGKPELPWPKVKTGDGPHDEWVYDVAVRVRPMSGGDAYAFWHKSLVPEGTPVEPGEGS